jgi:hypothetical protein
MSLLDAALCVTGGTTSLNEINGLFGGGVSTPIMAYGQRVFFRPMFELDAVRMLRHGTRQLEAIREPTWPAVQKELPEFVLQTSWMGRVTHWLSQMLSPAIDRAIMLHFRGLAQRRMAAIALALRLYEIDHGRRPAELSELVPEYLPAVPADPFASDGRSIAFRTTPHGALLYSVNTDGVDDQGQVAIDRNGNLRGDDKDLPFALDGQDLIAAATQPASTQAAVDHDDNVENGAGNADEDQSGRQQP